MMETTDHFNYPASQRKDTMYLSTIRPEESGFRQIKAQREFSSSLYTSDIDKAQPYLPGYAYANKPIFMNRNDDIQGSRPSKHHQPLEKPSYNLKSDDIFGAQPRSYQFVTTRQPTNPLIPEYKLPYVEVRATTPPKFVRDQIDIKDIPGAQPCPYTKYKYENRTLNVDDIDGACTRKTWIPKKPFDSLNVKDINEFYIFHTQRSTNPLSPRYKLADENKNIFEYGDVKGNKPNIRHPKNPQRLISFDLKSEDVQGAQADTALRVIRSYKTRETVNKTEDIPGARASSLKRGMKTNRQVDPLRPSYVLPGHSEMPADFFQNQRPVKVAKEHNKTHENVSRSVDVQAKITGIVPSNNENNIAFYDNSNQIDPTLSKLPSADRLSNFVSQKDLAATVQSNGDTQINENRQLHSNLLSSVGEKSLAKQYHFTASYKRNSVEDRGLVSSSSEFQRNAARFHGYEPNTLKTISKGNNSVIGVSGSQHMPSQTLNTRKQLVSSVEYQSNVENFLGEEKSQPNQNQSKNLSQVQKLDRFLK